MRLRFALSLTIAALVLPGATLGAGQPRLRIVDATVPVGGTLVAVGSGWPAASRVQLLIGPPQAGAVVVATARTTNRGSFRKGMRLSTRWKRGRYVLLACRRSCRVKVAANFRVG